METAEASARHFGVPHAFDGIERMLAFARAINEARECAPSFRDKLKIHRVWDAAEESARTRSWRPVDYSGV